MKWKSGFILRQIASEAILIPVGEAARQVPGILGLSESGAVLYEKLQSQCTYQELVDLLLQEYDVPPAEAARDVDAFLNRMRQLGVLEE